MPTTTTNYGLYKSLVNDPTDQDLWGGYLNTNFDTLDTQLKAVSDAVAAAVPVGVEFPYGGTVAPTNYLLCYGQAVSRTTYASLFAVYGTTNGAGDGSTTFNIPDYRGRSPFGRDDMGGSAANRITNAVSGITATTLGATGGSQLLHQHNHGVNDIGHTHAIAQGAPAGNSGSAVGGSNNVSASGGFFNTQSAFTGITINNAGTGSSQNMPPAIIRNWIVKAL